MKDNTKDERLMLLVADDHPSAIESIIRYLKESPDFEIRCVVKTIREVFYQLQTHKFDVIILDLNLPENRVNESPHLNGYEVLDFIKDNKIDILPIVFSANEDAGFVAKAKAKGAKGYLSKKVDEIEFREAIRTVAIEGKEYIEKNLLTKMVFKDESNCKNILLTQKERSILNYISEGLTSRQIGQKLNLANDTVRDYRDSLIKKFGAINSVNLVRIAAENGYLTQL